MLVNPRHDRPGRWIVVLASCLLVVLLAPMKFHAQATNPFITGICIPPPGAPAPDPWPIAATDSMSTSRRTLTFSGAALLANDTGTSLLHVVSVGPSSANGGTVTGTDPYTLTLASGFTGADVVTYEISDAAGQSAIGLVRVTATGDTVSPVVSLSAPLAGTTLAQTVAVAASATDNLGVIGVQFLLDGAALGLEDTAAPFQASWDTTQATNAAHTLTAIARDAAGNTAMSAPVAVTVSNVANVTVPDVVGLAQLAAQSAITSAGLSLAPPSWASSATVPQGSVISESPAAGASVAPNSPVTLLLSSGPAVGGPAVDLKVTTEGGGVRRTTEFNTSAPGEWLVAFVASDGPNTANGQSVTVSGAGLTWTRVQRAALRGGVAEIWTAFAPTVLVNQRVTSTQALANYTQSMLVMSFTGVSGVGASGIAGAATGAPSITLNTQGAGSVVYAIGNDWDRGVARTIPAGQVKVNEYVNSNVGTFWVQSTAAPVPAAGTLVRLNATAPTNDQWNFAIIELLSGAAPVPPANVNVPNVVGMASATAQSTITGATLTVGAITNAFSAQPLGQVLSQNPAAGTSVAQNSPVALTVSAGPAPSAAGPVLALSFNEGSGTAAVDASGTGNNGVIAGAVHVAGRAGFGTALSFDGVNDWVTVADSASLDLTSAMTLEAWVNPSSVNGWETVAIKERGTNALAYGLYAADGTAAQGGADGPAGYVSIGGTDRSVRQTAGLPLGTWTHLAVTYDGTTQRLYVNGVQVASRAQTGSAAATANPLRIGGNSPWGEFFSGLIDEVRIYKRALSAAEIATDMNTAIQ